MKRNRQNYRASQRTTHGSPAGMTLIEIMIVVIIMSMIAVGVGVAVLPQLEKAKIKDAGNRAVTIRGAAEMYMAENNECPSVDDLVSEDFLKKGTDEKDPWGGNYTIECDGTDISVTSEELTKALNKKD